jgi:hypothetical protein
VRQLFDLAALLLDFLDVLVLEADRLVGRLRGFDQVVEFHMQRRLAARPGNEDDAGDDDCRGGQAEVEGEHVAFIELQQRAGPDACYERDERRDEPDSRGQEIGELVEIVIDHDASRLTGGRLTRQPPFGCKSP